LILLQWKILVVQRIEETNQAQRYLKEESSTVLDFFPEQNESENQKQLLLLLLNLFQ
jgi:hypothetical protein